MVEDFSTRFGFEPVKIELAEHEMPDSLRSGLWDVTRMFYFAGISDRYSGFSKSFRAVCRLVWFDFLKVTMDDIPVKPHRALEVIKREFFSCPFHRVYSLIEYLVKNAQGSTKSKDQFCKRCNDVLKREKAAFRFAGDELVKVTDPEERQEVENAIVDSTAVAVSQHIRSAAKLYSSTPPDYRNSIKESISAVEAAVSFVIEGKTTNVAKPLKAVEEKFGIHPAMYQGFEKLYAWTSDERGIRHSLMDKDQTRAEEARLMLVSCSAFSNYLIALKSVQA